MLKFPPQLSLFKPTPHNLLSSANIKKFLIWISVCAVLVEICWQAMKFEKGKIPASRSWMMENCPGFQERIGISNGAQMSRDSNFFIWNSQGWVGVCGFNKILDVIEQLLISDIIELYATQISIMMHQGIFNSMLCIVKIGGTNI